MWGGTEEQDENNILAQSPLSIAVRPKKIGQSLKLHKPI
jgi:hypothetical protein